MKSKWVKKWPIEVVESVCKHEAFITEKGRPYYIVHQSLVFIVTTTRECMVEHKQEMKFYNLPNVRGYLENLEKRYFLKALDNREYPEYSLPIKPEGVECFKMASSLSSLPMSKLKPPLFNYDMHNKKIVDAVKDEEIQKVIDRLDDDKKIVMTDRIGWQKKVAEDYLTTEYCVRYRKRLGFGIIPKDAVKEKA